MHTQSAFCRASQRRKPFAQADRMPLRFNVITRNILKNVRKHSRYPPADVSAFRQEFIAFSIASGVLRFGSFVTKSGRTTPYFFDAGLFNTGARLGRLAEFYAAAINEAGIGFDMLFGPAYKGIVLAAATAVALARDGRDVPYAYNRKEAKDHGEGGTVVGVPLAGRVLILDDVMTAGTAARESAAIIRAAGAAPAGVVVCLDRMERGTGDLSAVQDVERNLALPVIAIATLDDLVSYLRSVPEHEDALRAIAAYRKQYGVAAHA
jgi:orotate phosphoribosyltransferase